MDTGCKIMKRTLRPKPDSAVAENVENLCRSDDQPKRLKFPYFYILSPPNWHCIELPSFINKFLATVNTLSSWISWGCYHHPSFIQRFLPVERLPSIIIITIMISKGFVWSGWEVACRISSVCSPPLHCALFASTASRYLPQSNRGQLIMNYLLFGLVCFSAGSFLRESWWDRYSPYRLRQTVTQICLYTSTWLKQQLIK